MARQIYARLGRPSAALLLLLFCLLAPVGWKVIMGADEGLASGHTTLVASAAPSFDRGVSALKGRFGSPSYLDPPASLPILVGANWRYFKGISSAPPSTWNTVGFDDTTWFLGPSGFGYGDGDDATDLSDMSTTPTYLSVYVRREFTIPDLGSIAGVTLTIDYDDGFIAYVNGAEVARSASMSAAGAPPAYNATATSHEAVAGGGGPAETITITTAQLVQGTNVVAIEGHNQATTSSDFSLIPSLAIALPPNAPPDAPSNPSPANLQTGLSTNPQLCVDVDDAEGFPLDVTFYGREATGVAGDPFTIIAMPDTQYYSESYPTTYAAQTTWIRDNRIARNIVFSIGLGDCVNIADIQAQWTNANAANSILEDSLLTGLADGIPYGIAVGNHDQVPNGTARTGADENATTVLYNQTFPKSRFSGRAYHGGNYPLPGFSDSMDNHYELFSAGGMDFIVFHLEWDNGNCSWPADGTPPTGTLTTCQNVMTWMRDILIANPTRRAIISSHFMGTPSSGGSGTMTLSNQGQAYLNMARPLPNVFLMLGGHLDQSNHREDVANDGHKIYTVVSDFQTRPNGGDGWLRIMTFDPQADTIQIETYSPTISGGRFINRPTRHADDQSNATPIADPNAVCSSTRTNSCNELLIPYDMDAGAPFVAVGTDAGAPAGTRACVNWPGLQVGTTYEWYAVASDGSSSTAGARQSFSTTTSCALNSECDDANPCTDDVCTGSLCVHANVSGCCLTTAECDDGNVCTDDACTANACVSTSNSSPCTDNNACTTGDFCSGGSCVGGSAANCADDNACTADSCSPAMGCASSYAPTPGCCTTNAECNDGLPGTTDTCAAGDCSNEASPACTTVGDCDDGDACTTDACMGGNPAALVLDGSGDYVTMGADPDLGLAQFSVECWFKRTGTGATANTGTGGFLGVPLVAKGVGESETDTFNANYFLGLKETSTGSGVWVLAADFEEGQGGGTLGLNHPVSGATAVTSNAWHHAVATYDGTTWSLYLDGNLDATLAVGQPAASNSIQHFGVGTALNSSGVASGFFAGLMDEVRVWDHARTPVEIQAGMSQAITGATGLVARWGFDEASGAALDSTTPSEDGALAGNATRSASDVPPLGSGTCSHTAVGCNDGNVCTVDSCDASTGCVYAPGNEGGSCDDGNTCTGNDVCGTGVCAGIPDGSCCQIDADCDDSNQCTTDSCVEANSAALSFNGSSEQVAFGAAATHPQLGLDRFTIEFWINRASAGVQTGYWSGGTTAVPLVTKGRGVGDGGNFDLNYFVGIDQTGVFVADFEQLEATAGADNRAAGTTTVQDGVWYHVAASYDGAALKLYVNGTLEGSLATTTTPRADSVHRFAIGTAWNDDASKGTVGPAGFFAGLIDEVRAWDHARPAGDIQSGMNAQIESASGLVGRWGMNEGSGASVGDSVGSATGTVSAAQWVVMGLMDLGAGFCTQTVATGAACEDGNLCLTGDTCDALGVCQPGAAPLDCDDANVCTDDACDNELGCVHYDNTAPCSDGSACTTSEMCDGGTCAGGTPVVCDDGIFCNGVETCNVSTGCVAGTPPSCDDGNPCTADLCDTLLGCVHGTDPAACDDLDACSADACIFAPTMSALVFDGTNDYVTMGAAPGLGATRFTLETWFYWTGGGVAVSTGTGGLASAIPLVGKGAAQAETPANVNMNYFLGIVNSRLAGDFEDTATGLNHPVCTAAAAPAITTNSWHHAAATYDGTRWRLYLDGAELSVDTACSACSGGACTVSPGATPEGGSIQYFGLGTTLTSTGVAAGFFQGRLDEVRIWNDARSAAEILAGRDRRISSDLGLKGRWSLDQGSGTSAPNSISPAEDGTLTNFDHTASSGWITGATVFSAAECSYPNAPNGTSCNDGNVCTAPDQCTAGNCAGAVVGGCCLTAAECNDANICTADACVANACDFSPIPGCTACTTDAQCDDVNGCTADSCNTANDAAISFAGTAGNRVQFPVGSGVDYLNNFGTGSFTVEGWVYTDGGAVSLTGIFRHGRQQDFPQVAVQLTGTGNLQLAGSVEAGNVGDDQEDITAPVMTANQWHHFALVVDRTPLNQQLRLYVDGGSLVATPGNTWGTSVISSTDPTVLGAARDGTGNLINPFDGWLDEIRIWNYARTPSETTADMSREITAAPGLMHRWGMNENTGTTTVDSVGASTGTLSTTTTPAPTWSATNLKTFGNDLCAHGNIASGTTCSDGSVCTSGETCDGSGVCGGGSTLSCDDSNVCTTDSCHAVNGCDNAPITGGGTTTCGVGTCQATVTNCVAGVAQICTPGTAGTEICDSLDNDCDGAIDNGNPGGGVQCGTDEGECSFGVTQCVEGTLTCAGGVGPTAEICDGTDNDCDGTVDTDAPLPSAAPEVYMAQAGALTDLMWSPVAESSSYDVVRIDLGMLLATNGDYARATVGCDADDYAGTSIVVNDPLPPGGAFMYLVRGVNCAGNGTYDSESSSQHAARDAMIGASPDSCP